MPNALSQDDFAIAIEAEGEAAEGEPASALRRSRAKLGRGNQAAHLLFLIAGPGLRTLDASLLRGDR